MSELEASLKANAEFQAWNSKNSGFILKGKVMTETKNESRIRLNKELDRIKKAIPYLDLSYMLLDRGQPTTFIGYIDECASFAVGSCESEVVLASCIELAIERRIKKLMADSRAIGKYIKERNGDGTDTESAAHNKA